MFGSSSQVTSEGKKGPRAGSGRFHEHAQGARLQPGQAAPRFVKWRVRGGREAEALLAPALRSNAAAAAARPVRRQCQKAVWLFMNGQKTHGQRACLERVGGMAGGCAPARRVPPGVGAVNVSM